MRRALVVAAVAAGLIWYRIGLGGAHGEVVGARFVSAKELRQGLEPAIADPTLAQARAD